MFTLSQMQITGINRIATLNMDNKDGITLTRNINTQMNGRIKGKEIVFIAGNDILLATSSSYIAVNTDVHIKADNGVSK